jgi:hypothetical protein
MLSCGLRLEISYVRLKNSKLAICNVQLKVTSWLITDATCEALLKFRSNLSKFIRAQLNSVTAQRDILHNYNNFHAQTESVSGQKNKKFCPIGFQTAQPKKIIVRKNILRLTVLSKYLCSQNTGVTLDCQHENTEKRMSSFVSLNRFVFRRWKTFYSLQQNTYMSILL